MNLRRLTLVRPNMGDYRSADAMMPLSMAVLAARTPSGVELRLFDDRVEVLPPDDTPDLAAITVETFTARRAYQIADGYRARGVPVVMGGYHPTFLPDEALQHADAVVIGDAEGSWEELLSDFDNGSLRKRYVSDGNRALDDFKIDRSIFAGKPYGPVELVQYGRGCRFACDFCSITAFYNEGTRRRAPESVAEELSRLNRRRVVFFVDDNLFADRASLLELLRVLKPLGVRWACQISIDVARDNSLLDLMAEAGCMVALIGFESLSTSNLRQMGKGWNRVSGDYGSVVRRFHDRGIAVYGTFVFGYDDDTVDTVKASLEFAIEACLDIANFNPLTPTPGSLLYERLRGEGRLISPEWWLDPGYRYGDPIFVPRGMSPEAFSEACFAAKRAFYSWSSMARRLFRGSLDLDWFRTGMVGLANLISRKEVLRKQYRALGV
jgi:radical SAM superfamily enzyme YgiQ (UPF0313 family)